jgi:hypothetical protein
VVWVYREENLEYARDILLTKLLEVVELEPIRQEEAFTTSWPVVVFPEDVI